MTAGMTRKSECLPVPFAALVVGADFATYGRMRRAVRPRVEYGLRARGRVQANPAGAGQIDLAPGVQIGEINLGATGAVERCMDRPARSSRIMNHPLKQRLRP